MAEPLDVDALLLTFARLTRENWGIPPTVREFAHHTGSESSSVGRYRILILEEVGYVGEPDPLRNTTQRRWRALTAKGWERVFELEGRGS